MLRGLQGWHALIIVGALIVLFGGKRLPDAARGLGRSLRIFKSEVKQMQAEDAPPTPTAPVEGRVMDAPVDQPAPAPASQPQHPPV